MGIVVKEKNLSRRLLDMQSDLEGNRIEKEDKKKRLAAARKTVNEGSKPDLMATQEIQAEGGAG